MYFREKCLMREISRHDCFYDRYKRRGHERTSKALARMISAIDLKSGGAPARIAGARNEGSLT
jgi:hypothetical protein